MGINNFVTGDSKRHASEESLLKTEKTDAVNSGLVGSSDRTRSSMVSSAAEKHAAGNRGAIRPKGGVADVTSGAAKRKSTANSVFASKAGKASNSVKSAGGKNAAGKGKVAAKYALERGFHKAAEGSEIEDLDNARINARRAKNVGKEVWKLSKKNFGKKGGKGDLANPKNSIDGLAEKGYRAKKSAAAIKTEMQVKKHQMSALVNAQQAASRAAQAAASEAVQAIGAVLKALAGAISGAIGAIGAPVAAIIMLIMVIVILIAAIIGGGVASDDGDDDAVAGGSAETYVAKALVYAGDNSIGYCYDFPSPAHCRNHNPDMDCSSFIWYSLVDSGYVSKDNLPGPFSTHSMPEALAAIGFTDVTSKVNLSTGQGLQRGDILINRANHTELYIGNGKNVGAHQDKDGRPGDSSGLEVCTNDYYNFPWTHVMRPPVGSDLDGIHASPEKAKEIAKSVIAKEYPQWNNGTQWEALEWIWTEESGWRYNAENPSSGAYGIPQALPADKMITAGFDWHENATTQIKWGLKYISGRYGSPVGAKSFWLSHNWY